EPPGVEVAEASAVVTQGDDAARQRATEQAVVEIPERIIQSAIGFDGRSRRWRRGFLLGLRLRFGFAHTSSSPWAYSSAASRIASSVVRHAAYSISGSAAD